MTDIDPARLLVAELNAKAAQSTRHKTRYKTPARQQDHVCARAAEMMLRLIHAPAGSVSTALVREIFTRRLDLTSRQRAYSWHEIQDALSEVTAAARALTQPATPASGPRAVDDVKVE